MLAEKYGFHTILPVPVYCKVPAFELGATL